MTPPDQSAAPEPPDGEATARRHALEIRKLELEIEEGRERLRRGGSFLARLRSATVFLLSVASLFGAAWGLYETQDRYFTQRARELEFQVNLEMIQLAEQLRSADTTEGSYAALLLASFEEHAIPILVAKLATAEPELVPYITRSLELIAAKPRIEKKPGLVVRPLLRQASYAMSGMGEGLQPSIKALDNYVMAVRDVVGRIEDESLHGEALKFLRELREQVAGGPGDEIPLEHSALISRIDDAVSHLKATP